MDTYLSDFFSSHPVISVFIAAILIVLVYLFSRYLSPSEMKRFSLYMSIGIVFLVLLFVVAIYVPQAVSYYPYIILAIALAICFFLYKRINLPK